MKLYRNRLLSTTYMTLAIGGTALVVGAALPGANIFPGGVGVAYAACNPCNPCASANPCNPCNPCAALIKNPCNPCSAAPAAGPCNPCAAATPCNPCNPCAASN
jgi:hypothetical protein